MANTQSKGMQYVEPIRDIEKIAAIKANLKAQKNPRDYLLFVMGINSALRISDLLRLTVGDVQDEHGRFRDHLYLHQKKTGGRVMPKINSAMRDALGHYFGIVGHQAPETPLFRAERSGNALDRTWAWNLINQWCKAVGLDGANYGTHSLRKSWGYHAFHSHNVPLGTIMHKLGQKSESATLRYLGITQDEVNNVEERVCL